MNTYTDTLTQWWENAERGTARKGDSVILRNEDGSYEVHPDAIGEDREYDHLRILERAPKPKPAWHDAVAVIAWTDLAERQVWERDGGGTYCGTAGDVADDYELHDVTPLIEAKVTDEMIERGRHIGQKGRTLDAVMVRRILTAALGIEAE